MSDLTRRPAAAGFRVAAVAAMFGAVTLLAPGFAARAQTPEEVPSAHSEATAAMNPASSHHWSHARHAEHETLEQRITALHKALKITPDEEGSWGDVAGVMRDNEAAMQALGAEKHAATAETATAVEDLKAYQKFAQVHVDGLTKLVAAFGTLYAAMPDEQKQRADQVFADFGHKSGHARK